MRSQPSVGLFDQFRPDVLPVMWAKIAPGNSMIGFALDRRAELLASGTISVPDVSQIADACPTARSKSVALRRRHRGEELFELNHSRENTPYGLEHQHWMVYFTIWFAMV